ncbi:MAG TPA: hypothetical protein VFE58_16145 [Tepidisphaeraceae bacterium]|jgi:hypothetical protein|nr:hypothetical protein [Tepidisphaeraceae bacterium]
MCAAIASTSSSAGGKQQPTHKPAQGYEVGRPGGKCAVSGRDILPGDRFMAALRETPEGFERIDVSMEAWEEFDKTGLLGFWQTTMPHAEAKKKLFVDDEVLCGLFERLADTAEPAKLNFRFVLGLILMRKRMLVYESSRHDGDREIWSMRFKGREDRLDLLNPKLDEQQVMEVSQQLSEILNEEL